MTPLPYPPLTSLSYPPVTAAPLPNPLITSSLLYPPVTSAPVQYSPATSVSLLFPPPTYAPKSYPPATFAHMSYPSMTQNPVSHSLLTSVPISMYSPNTIVGSHPPTSSIPAVHLCQQPTLRDSASYLMLRQEVLRPSGKPFCGDPHEYHCWGNVMSNKIKGIDLEAYAILTALHANSTGKPQKLIEQHMAVGSVNPNQTLHDVWEALFDQYGLGTQIANSLMSKVSSFQTILDPHNVAQF